MSDLTVLDCEQRSVVWYAARCGIVTASTVGNLVTVNPPSAITVDCPACGTVAGSSCIAVGRKIRTEIRTFHEARSNVAADLPPVYGPADNDTTRAIVATLAAERITGHVEDTYTSPDMFRGIIAEPFARELYAEHCTDQPVTEVGFMIRDFGGFVLGYSPDGLVGDDGLIEIKAPRQKGHLTTVVDDQVPARYMPQLQAGLLVSGCKWIDYVSYSGGMHLWRTRVFPDPAWQAAILAATERTEQAITDTVAAYQQAVIGLPLAERIDFDQEVVI